MKLMNKSFITFGILLAAYFAWLTYISIFQASANLKNPLVNEADKRSALSMSPSLPTEYLEDGSLFWWITTEGMNLNYANNLNEQVVGELSLYLSGNPCKQVKELEIEAGSFGSYRSMVSNENIVPVIIKINLEPYESLTVTINSQSDQLCKIKNGDTREFVARLDGWIFD